jgi:hypothetical protein
MMEIRRASHDPLHNHHPKENKMTSHTPGPWIVFDNGADHQIFNADQNVWIADAKKYDESNPDEVAEAIANARLIAAAPDLLAALKMLLESSDRDPKGEEDAYQAAETAIAKTEGR